MQTSASVTCTNPPLPRMVGLLMELEDLKRQQPAGFEHSIATTLFQESWQRWLRGDAPDHIALTMTTKALVAILLPGVGADFFRQTKLQSEAEGILQSALQKIAQHRLPEPLYQQLAATIPGIVADYQQPIDESMPQFVKVLSKQPRAGATKPGKPRILLLPPEMHSDHSLMTAVFAVLLSPYYEAAPGQPFLTELAHHLHNAVLPDCGFGGEVLLDPWLDEIIQTGRKQALAEVPIIAEQVLQSIAVHEDLSLPAGRAASAADVLDRVLDVQWRTRILKITNEDILSELELVHAGPIKQFQTELLSQAGVWPLHVVTEPSNEPVQSA